MDCVELFFAQQRGYWQVKLATVTPHEAGLRGYGGYISARDAIAREWSWGKKQRGAWSPEMPLERNQKVK
ncbi:MAG: hypothetical protein EA392_14330 [Cryomorphaceae bacterium]|nr:MAG: hypothetical protein EA392_14330 [Cryomorphaceae bacterium]